MTNLRTVTASSPAAPTLPSPAHRHRLRAVAPDEVPPVAELLHPGATWMPAPQHTLPDLPGQPPMIGYLVLVPADQALSAAPGLPAPVPAPRAPGAQGPDVPGPAAPRTLTEGDALVRIDPEQRTAHIAGKPLDLTYLEFELLAHLVAHPHRVHTRDQLVTTVWGYGHVGDGRTVDVHVARLRRKMGAEHRSSIVTVRRVGYKYAPPAGL
ncbi:transcriptional regulator [Streptomyces cinnamoneus]|uniref:Transcriptional regulator n=1 Tax=Streptomyces cinnamoneus TaxID=53446 RepID=A0A2G1XGD9_STRCJ|nr:winged helix-turn-helix domain-containing protein [Streptomyces cinnamoneus]PHQ50308.1 transcriptional regulator [Streptomyces cinnamoneus]PPT12905.1 winged helix family transcriptional regulator [Streptomyces cinnamoneus]